MNGGMLEIWKFHGWALLAGCLIDWLIGDPRWLPHPVRLMGRMISALEFRLRGRLAEQSSGGASGDSSGSGRRDFFAGLLLVLVMCSVWTVLPIAAAVLIDRIFGRLFLFAAEAFFCSQLLAARDLAKESLAVKERLDADDTEGARRAVSMIVGRDTRVLDRAGITRAAVETVAENASDGVAAPFIFMALLGPAGGALYKAANTMDSMLGYKNSRYLYFGRAAARLDDVLNFIPARVNGVLLVLSAWLLPGFDGKNAWRIFCRDRLRHASPNAAHGEAACAGALHLRLAGDAWYFGELHKKPYLGDDDRPVQAEDIRRTCWLMLGAQALLMACLAALLGLAAG